MQPMRVGQYKDECSNVSPVCDAEGECMTSPFDMFSLFALTLY